MTLREFGCFFWRKKEKEMVPSLMVTNGHPGNPLDGHHQRSEGAKECCASGGRR